MLSLLLTGLFTVSGCSEYRTFNYKTQQGIRFSFEYPIEDGKPSIVKTRTSGVTKVGLYFDQIHLISLYIRPLVNDGLISELELSLSMHSKTKNFQLLDNSPVLVSGIPAEQYTFTYTPTAKYVFDETDIFDNVYCMNVFFEYKDLIWSISMFSIEQDNIYFERVLQTFTIKD